MSALWLLFVMRCSLCLLLYFFLIAGNFVCHNTDYKPACLHVCESSTLFWFFSTAETIVLAIPFFAYFGITFWWFNALIIIKLIKKLFVEYFWLISLCQSRFTLIRNRVLPTVDLPAASSTFDGAALNCSTRSLINNEKMKAESKNEIEHIFKSTHTCKYTRKKIKGSSQCLWKSNFVNKTIEAIIDAKATIIWRNK